MFESIQRMKNRLEVGTIYKWIILSFILTSVVALLSLLFFFLLGFNVIGYSATNVTNNYLNGTALPMLGTVGSGLSLIFDSLLYKMYSLGNGYGTTARLDSETLKIDLHLIVENPLKLTNVSNEPVLSLLLAILGGQGINVTHNPTTNTYTFTNTGVLQLLSSDVRYGTAGIGLLSTQNTGALTSRTIASANSLLDVSLAAGNEQVSLTGSGTEYKTSDTSPSVIFSGIDSFNYAYVNYQSIMTPTNTIGEFFRMDMTFSFNFRAGENEAKLAFNLPFAVIGRLETLIAPVSCYSLDSPINGKPFMGYATGYAVMFTDSEVTIVINAAIGPTSMPTGERYVYCSYQFNHFAY